jgi:hypothetical protein
MATLLQLINFYLFHIVLTLKSLPWIGFLANLVRFWSYAASTAALSPSHPCSAAVPVLHSLSLIA